MNKCIFAIYYDTAKATEIKIHKTTCPNHKKNEGHDYEWFYAPTYSNAKILAELLSKNHGISFRDCEICEPSILNTT